MSGPPSSNKGLCTFISRLSRVGGTYKDVRKLSIVLKFILQRGKALGDFFAFSVLFGICGC